MYIPGRALKKTMAGEKISRRETITAIAEGIGLVGATGGVAAYLSSWRMTEAERLFEEFPLVIPGARGVRKYPTRGARQCLVHVLQTHYPSEGIVRETMRIPSLKITDEEAEEIRQEIFSKENISRIKTVQDDVYRILSHFIDNLGLDYVHMEGDDVDSLELFRKIKDELTVIEKEIDEFIAKLVKEINPSASYNDVQRIKKKVALEIAESGYYKETKTYFHGPHELYFEGRIQLRPAEKMDTGEIDLDDEEAVNDLRENSLLEIISEYGDTVAVTVFGGGHAFGGPESCGQGYDMTGRKSYRDNIAEWNKMNPSRKFSLIEVVPASYELE